MTDIITEEMIQRIANLAMLELSDQESMMAKKDMEEMLNFLDKLNELDIDGTEPLTQIFSMNNVFREDLADIEDNKNSAMTNKENMLANAPQTNNGYFQVPRTVDR